MLNGMLQVADHLKARVQDLRKLVIWGNHSNTQFPDARFTEVHKDGNWVSITKVQHDEKWLKETLIPIVQKRGAEVIAARKLSSAMSAAQAAADHMKDWFNGTQKVSSVLLRGSPQNLGDSFTHITRIEISEANVSRSFTAS